MSLVGHAVPAAFFFGFGGGYLGLTFKRCRELVRSGDVEKCHGGLESFCDLHIPERNAALLGGLGMCSMVASTIGALIEILSSYHHGSSLFHKLAHEALYFCFCLVGAVASLESRRRLPPDSWRVATAFAFFLQYLLWNEHGLMKEGIHGRAHILLAQINLAAAVAFAYSVYNPKSLLAYVAAGALVVLNALWMFTVGLIYYGVDIVLHIVAAVLVLEALLVAAIVVIGAALLGGNANDDSGSYDVIAFAKPLSSADDEECNGK